VCASSMRALDIRIHEDGRKCPERLNRGNSSERSRHPHVLEEQLASLAKVRFTDHVDEVRNHVSNWFL